MREQRREVVNQMPAQIRDETLCTPLAEEVIQPLEEFRGFHNNIVPLGSHLRNPHTVKQHREVYVGIRFDEFLLRDMLEGFLQRHVWLQTLIDRQLRFDFEANVSICVCLFLRQTSQSQLGDNEFPVGSTMRLHLVVIFSVEGVVWKNKASGAEVEVHQLWLQVVSSHPPIKKRRDIPKLKLRHDFPQVLIGLDIRNLFEVGLQRFGSLLVDIVHHHARPVPVTCFPLVFLENLPHLVVDLGRASIPGACKPPEVLRYLNMFLKTTTSILIKIFARICTQIHLSHH
mmetsp:Transcript_47862/g.150095  ORF Transcript_47862/g.150095 Transcript_47862/m.150095 type:complete len:286 (-) Transcript_47862:330-1187(-)